MITSRLIQFSLFLFLMHSQQEHIKKESICQPVEEEEGRGGQEGEYMRVCVCTLGYSVYHGSLSSDRMSLLSAALKELVT